MSNIEKIDFPLLVVAADDDDIVDIKQAKNFEKKAKKLKKTNIQIQIFKNEDHGIVIESNQMFLAEKALGFFKDRMDSK